MKRIIVLITALALLSALPVVPKLAAGSIETNIFGLSIKGSVEVVDYPVVTGVTNYPPATKGQRFMVTTHAWIGGAAGTGKQVNIGDIFECTYSNAGGNHAEVGLYWTRIPSMISADDGYRYVQMAINTIPPTAANCYYFLPDGMYYNDSAGVSHKITGVP